MKIRNPAVVRFIGFLAAGLVRAWMSTVRYRVRRDGQILNLSETELEENSLCIFWHEHLMFAAGRRWNGKLAILTSQHADGEIIAQMCRSFRIGVVRGSTSRGGFKAVRELMRKGQHASLVVIPDGPRGPRRRVQAGVVYLASKTGMPIVSIGVAYTNAWRANSWDRFAVPIPGCQALGVTGRAIHVPPNLDREGIEKYRILVEQEFLTATHQAERWAESVRGTRHQALGAREERKPELGPRLTASA